MSNTIHILPLHLANKIAAGEVVQRPESVVKELMENSIDAGAGRISVNVKDGGKTLVQVTDDGTGMSEDDASIAFLRHATSKISEFQDLENIRTLGFRGEALASVAAVSHVQLKTRREVDEIGVVLRIEGGEVKEKSNAGMSAGTSVTVKNLFFNTPARRNFLKSNNTEFRHVYDVIQRMALSHPEIALEFVSDDERLLDLQPSSPEERLKNLYGERHFETLIPITEKNEFLSVAGFIGKPDFARKSRVDQYLFLNKRYIMSRAINHAVYAGYEHLVEKGNFPFFAIFIGLDPRKVDVNVHPSKMEVKFADESAVYRFMLSAVRKALGEHDAIPALEVQAYHGTDLTSLRHSSLPRFFPRTSPEEQRGPLGADTHGGSIPADVPFDIEKIFTQRNALPEDGRAKLQADRELIDDLPEGRAVWQIHNKYILCEIRAGIMIVDQHVAHERILYEKALASFNNAIPLSQQLLFPQTVQLSAGDYALAQELAPHMEKLGFELRVFGKNTVVLEGVPADVRAGTEQSILQDVLDEFKNNQHRVRLDARDNLAKSFSCKAAIKAGEKLSETEMRSLLDRLLATTMPFVCPHGRPILVKISLSELDRRFMRT